MKIRIATAAIAVAHHIRGLGLKQWWAISLSVIGDKKLMFFIVKLKNNCPNKGGERNMHRKDHIFIILYKFVVRNAIIGCFVSISLSTKHLID